LNLIILHYHFRPGGVRRVIELAAPDIVRSLAPNLNSVVLATGEAPDDTWLKTFSIQLLPLQVKCAVEPALRYLNEQPSTLELAANLQRFLSGLLPAHADTIVWAHNLGLGRNLPLADALNQASAASGARLILHHHDWWFDNRWSRWPEMRRTGYQRLPQVADALFGTSANCFHAAINQADARILKTNFGPRAEWLPNPGQPQPTPAPREVAAARKWLKAHLGDDAPVWLMPCRLLRRKNLAEALLLARWLHPEARLVTTGGPSSSEEEPYARTLRQAALQHGWRLHLSVLAGAERGKPSIPSLLECGEVVLLTSLQEGFGLPYLEATGARKPLLARALPNVMPDLEQLGFRFPHTYPEILADCSMFDLPAERLRQEHLYKRWRATLPGQARRVAGRPALLSCDTGSVPFSRLTLAAQLEVLSIPPEQSWAVCATLNPFLPRWQKLAREGKLRPAAWPSKATRRLEPRIYAQSWCELLERQLPPPKAAAAGKAQAEFINARVAGDNLYPLLWT
jgi:glycosyltransferase involved in cell wall biosynthesis